MYNFKNIKRYNYIFLGNFSNYIFNRFIGKNM